MTAEEEEEEEEEKGAEGDGEERTLLPQASGRFRNRRIGLSKSDLEEHAFGAGSELGDGDGDDLLADRCGCRTLMCVLCPVLIIPGGWALRASLHKRKPG